jgi:hypothetical protein
VASVTCHVTDSLYISVITDHYPTVNISVITDYYHTVNISVITTPLWIFPWSLITTPLWIFPWSLITTTLVIHSYLYCFHISHRNCKRFQRNNALKVRGTETKATRVLVGYVISFFWYVYNNVTLINEGTASNPVHITYACTLSLHICKHGCSRSSLHPASKFGTVVDNGNTNVLKH